MTEEYLREKVDYISNKVDDIESLIARRLVEDKAKNALINELTNYLLYRQELDKGVAFSKIILDIVKVTDRLKEGEPTEEFNTSVYEELFEVLSRYGLKQITTYEILDPKIHEVVSVEEHSNIENDAIIKVVQQGYMIEKKILRPSKVIINKRQELTDIESIK